MSDDSIFSAAGFDTGGAPPQDTPAVSSGSLFKDAGFSLPTPSKPAKVGKQFSDEIPIPVPPDNNFGADKSPETLTDTLDRIHSSLSQYNPGQVAKSALGAWGNSIAQEGAAGSQQIGAGVKEALSGLPASGISNVASGLGRQVSALTGLTAASNAVGSAVTNLTGNPDVGQRASTLFNILGPAKSFKAVEAAVPSITSSQLPALTPGYNAALAGRDVVPPANAAIDQLVDDIGARNVPAAIQKVQSSGGRLALMDASDPVRTKVQGLVDPAQPEAMRAIVNNVKDRISTQPDAVNSAYTKAMGPNPDVGAVLDKLKQRAQDVGKNLIQPAIDNAGPVDITGVINGLDKTIGPYALKPLMNGESPALPMTDAQNKAWELRQTLRGSLPDHDPNGPLTPNLFLDPDQAHEIQSNLRYQGSTLSKSATGSDRLIGGQVMGVRNQLVNAIDSATNGTYKPALSSYKDAKDVQESFDNGFQGNVLKNRQGVLEDRPEEFQKWFDAASPEQIMATQLGTRADIDRQINGVRNPVQGAINIAKIPYNQEKLTTLFGDKEAGRLITAMQNASLEGATNNKVINNSKTAETLLANQAMRVPSVDSLSQNVRTLGTPAAVLGGLGVGGEALGTLLHAPIHGGIPALTAAGMGTALGLGKMGQQALIARHTLARNTAYARYASATSGPDQSEVMRALMSHPQVVSELNKPSYLQTTP